VFKGKRSFLEESGKVEKEDSQKRELMAVSNFLKINIF
jgi:hypothetical protein